MDLTSKVNRLLAEFAGRIGFVPADCRMQGQKLAVYVRNAYRIVIDEHKTSDAASRKGFERIRTDAAEPEHGNFLIVQLLYRVFPDKRFGAA